MTATSHPAFAGDRSSAPGAAILALGFATTVAMWAAGFLARLPAVGASPVLVLPVLVLLFLAGAALSGRYAGAGAGWRLGLLVGALNLLVLGSLLIEDSPGVVRPGALLWLPGFVVAMAVVGAAGAWLGSRTPAAGPRSWTAVFAHVAAAATLFLLLVGGLVTSKEAGLAVTDWPNSFGYNMFLYPLSKMTGGIYFEHTHRLFGSLVGLTTLVLAVHLHRVESRGWVRRLALLALLLVTVQGVLGGLRVTGGLTLSTSPEDMAPSTPLAAVHGVLGQLVFGLLVALAVVVRGSFREARGAAVSDAAETDRGIATAVPVLVAVQLVLGAVLRHFSWGLLPHVTMAAVVLVAVIAAGIRALRAAERHPALGRLGKVVMPVVLLQIMLGIGALTALMLKPEGGPPTSAEVILATAHQATGAVLLAVAVMLAVWTHRLRLPAGAPMPAAAPGDARA